MNNRICFSSILKDKNVHNKTFNKTRKFPSLIDLLQEYEEYPMKDFTLYFSSMVSHQGSMLSQYCSKGSTFENQENPLEAWISSKSQQNKQNFASTLQKNNSSKLLQFINKNNSKQKNSNVSNIKKSIKNNGLGIKQLCKQYTEGKYKENGNDMVWKFNQTNQHEKHQINVRGPSKKRNQQASFHEEKKSSNSYEEKNSLQNSDHQSIRKDICEEVPKIKQNMIEQIEVMAGRIIQERSARQKEIRDREIKDREIKDREIRERQVRERQMRERQMRERDINREQQQNEKKRYQQVQRQIHQYLAIKKAQQENQQIEPNHGHCEPVGFSFSSGFNSHIQAQNQYQHIEHQNEDISLPNIDEVKSQRDEFDRHELQQVFAKETQNIPYQHKKYEEIDKNYIKEIQSVAYQPPKQTLSKVELNMSELKEEESVNASLEEKNNSNRNLKNVIQFNNNLHSKIGFNKVKPAQQVKYEGDKQDEIEKEESLKDVRKFEKNSYAENMRMSKKSSLKHSDNQEQPKKMIKLTLAPNYQSQSQNSEESAKGEKVKDGDFQFELDF